MDDASYQEKLAGEAALWGRVAEEQAERVPPDWRYHRDLRHNAVVHARDIDALLARIIPGMKALELGCASGWLTLAMAQRGAAAHGMDISEGAIAVARAYYESIKGTVPGTATYALTDLNALDLPPATYDVIAAKGVLHHLVRLEHVIDQVHAALKPGGLLWVSDTHGDESLPVTLLAGALTLALPTQVSYREKVRGLLRFGLRAPQRVKASIQADGLSPFEGAGRDQDWVALVRQRFAIERAARKPAVTGYVTAQLALPDRVAVPLLRALAVPDRWAVRLGLLRSTGVVLFARKEEETR
ncbi:MAG: class I SAM-dependent methyltransferase [Anaerolineae bacterium]|nr:class I SAM-dependent methyltransferase [Anaerolineae bacterium]